MAASFNGTTDQLGRTTGLPSRTAFTACGWAKRNADTGNYSVLFSLWDAGGNTLALSFVENGDNIQVFTHAANSATIITPGSGNWFFWAITGGATLVGYAGVGTDALSTQSIAQATFTPDTMSIGNISAASYYLNGDIGPVKIWDATLTQAEIENERWQYLPNRLANLHLFSPLINTGGTSFLDISGAGRNWTEGGTVIDASGPPISWKMGRHRVLIPVAAGGSIVPLLLYQYRARRV